MAEENVVVVRFTEPSKAYQALSVLKECSADGRTRLESAAVVERTTEDALRIPEGTDNVGLIGTASGSLIGMLIGVLGGPVGARRPGRCSSRPMGRGKRRGTWLGGGS